MPEPTPQSAALPQAREHGLWGRADSPPDWQKALEGSAPGDPILVKHPDDQRDDFYLIQMHPAVKGVKHRVAWIMLDTVTLKLREAALLDHWKIPAFPTTNDAQQAAKDAHTLPDGTKARFKAHELKPNTRNLVWQASAASLLPYWPVKELIGKHPVTGAPVSIYVNQEGHVYTELAPDEPQSPSRGCGRWIIHSLLVVTLAALAYVVFKPSNGKPPEFIYKEVEKIVIKELPVEKIIIKEVKVPVEVIKFKEVIKEVEVVKFVKMEGEEKEITKQIQVLEEKIKTLTKERDTCLADGKGHAEQIAQLKKQLESAGGGRNPAQIKLDAILNILRTQQGKLPPELLDLLQPNKSTPAAAPSAAAAPVGPASVLPIRPGAPQPIKPLN